MLESIECAGQNGYRISHSRGKSAPVDVVKLLRIQPLIFEIANFELAIWGDIV